MMNDELKNFYYLEVMRKLRFIKEIDEAFRRGVYYCVAEAGFNN